MGDSAGWKVEVMKAVGDRVGEDGQPKKEQIELWLQVAADCVKELMGNSLFRDSLSYAPERHYADEHGRDRLYKNTCTSNWWWDIQNKLPFGATVAPVILASDKTTLSRMSGDKSAWPVYLTLGNIDKRLRRKPSAHVTVLLGYILVAKLECFSDKRWSLEGYRLFHLCMKKLLAPLVAAGRDSLMMTCADGEICCVYPILAAYIADHPEQCLVAACQENHCPKCPVPPDKRGEPVFSCLKNPVRVSEILKEAASGDKPQDFANLGLWALHKGVLKDHLVSWATQVVADGSNEHSDLCHFKNGISLVSQWTGTKFCTMEKVFLSVVSGGADEHVVRAVRAILDFIYLAHFEAHTDHTLEALHQAWRDFHTYKHVFIELEIREHFNFPKGHSMEHYEPSIRSVGTANGYNTEHPKRLHIDIAKLAYGVSNKQATYIQQMTRWLERQEAVYCFARYLEWANSQPPPMPAAVPPDLLNHLLSTGFGMPDDHSIAACHPPLPATSTQHHGPSGYHLAKVPAFPSLSVVQMECNFGATHFRASLQDYLQSLTADNIRLASLVSSLLHDLARVSAYKQAKVQLPIIRQVSAHTLIDIIHATPPRLGTSPLHLAKASNMSTILAHDPAAPAHSLCVARVHVIFNLPQQYDARLLGVTGPLAYVEWFTPFHALNTTTGMYVVSPSTRQCQRNTSVIPLAHIVCTCHLIPCWGRQIQCRVVAGDVLDNVDTKFFVNPYLRHHNFVLFRLLCNTL
ncbi:hypothetical protein C2E23DRAFT_868160 [Lenzites betulinus]|nr:hypothetical protein C2E23DRAFT_868160 [Lenzites betulinus]